MSDTDYKKSAGTQNGGQPKPWEQQPGEPSDCYFWFRLFLSMVSPNR